MSPEAVTVTVVDHPLVVDALARIRDRTTPNALFRQNLERIGTLLMARATESLPTIDTTVETPLTQAPAKRLSVQPVVVPILRAGLGFVHAAQELLPDADVGFVGISRDEATFAPKPYVNKLPESLAGDGIATAVSALVGGTPSTTYAENIGVMAVTRVYAVQVFWYAGALAFLIGGFVPKISALISSIPTPVMGGVSILLFGLIASSGLRMLVESDVDYSQTRNLIVSGVVLVIGSGNLTLKFGDYEIPAMALATLVGVGLNLALPRPRVGAPVAES